MPEEDNKTSQTTVHEAKPRRKWRFDPATRSVIMTEPSGSSSTYPLTSLPATSADYIAQLGLVVFCGRAEKPDEAFDKLVAGDIKPPAGEPKPKQISVWRQAIAAAMQDVAKKNGAPMTADEAKAKAADLPKETVGALKVDPAVIRDYNKMTGTTLGGVAALLAAYQVCRSAGRLTPPPPSGYDARRHL